MKKTLKTLLATALVVGTVAVSAAASSFDHAADALKSMNLFQGTEQGYQLDRAPTRGEAATMLVRLLGKEAAAKELTYSAPFTDLADWQKPYVQYLYENKLTTGATETTFEPEGACSAQMYTTFLLRSLGYSDASGDFTYATAMAKGKEIQLVDMANCNEKNFLRDHVVAMSYTALACPSKGDNKPLLEKLVADGAIESAKAQPVLNTFETYYQYLADTNTMTQATKMDMDMAISAKLTSGNETVTLDMPMSVQTDMNMQNMDSSKMAIKGKMTATSAKAGVTEKQEQDVSYYYADGYYYMASGDEKIKMAMSMNQSMGQFSDMSSTASQPISMIQSIQKSGDTYTIIYSSDSMNALVSSVLSSMDSLVNTTGMTANMDKVEVKVSAKDGQISTMDMSMNVAFAVAGEKLDMSISAKYTVKATGDSVKIVAPTDLDSYKLIG